MWKQTRPVIRSIWTLTLCVSTLVAAFIVSPLLGAGTEAAAVSELEVGLSAQLSGTSQTEPCELPPPPPLGLSNPALGSPIFGQGGDPASTGSPQLVITCFRMDRSHYPYGAMWHTEVVVTNIGNADSESFGVTGLMCRYKANSANSFDCNTSVWSLGLSDSLAPGESVLLQSSPHPFMVPLDPPGQYPSWVPGLPDNGTVYLKAHVDTMVPGQYVVTQAVYPSAPSENTDPSFVDADQDGWSPDGNPAFDCADDDPSIHPGANEIVGDGLDNDCSGGDVSAGGSCSEAYYGMIHGGPALCPPPASNTFPDLLDLDGDGVTVGEGDCDDFNAFIHPFAPEMNDSIDNNCNGLVDETYAQPDWTIENYNIERVMGDYTLPNGTTILVPGLNYEVEIGNVGDYIGEDFSILQAVQHDILFYGPPIATGTSGFIPFTQMPSSHLYGCTEQQLGATIAQTGLYGEVNFSNNFAEFWVPPISTDFLSLHFDDIPDLTLAAGNDSALILTHAALTGACPDLPTALNGVTEYVQVQRRLLGHNQVLYDETLLGVAYLPSVPLPENVSIGDLFCLQVVLDPNHLIAEDADDNMYAVIFEYKNPIFGPPRFDVVEQVLGPFGTINFNRDDCEVSSTDQTLIGSSPGPNIPFIAIVLVGFAGIVLGGIGGQIAGVSTRMRSVLILIGLLAGSTLGGLSAARSASADEAGTRIAIEDPGSPTAGLPVCEVHSQADMTWPLDGATIIPQDPTPLTWEATFANGHTIPDQVTFLLTSPAGEEILLLGHHVSSNAGVQRYETGLPLGEELYLAGINLIDVPGDYAWSIAIASAFTPGSDLAVPVCAGSGSYTFQVGDQPIPTATPTPTATGILITPASSTPTSPPATRTPKPTSPPPTRTPVPKVSPTPTIYIP